MADVYGDPNDPNRKKAADPSAPAANINGGAASYNQTLGGDLAGPQASGPVGGNLADKAGASSYNQTLAQPTSPPPPAPSSPLSSVPGTNEKMTPTQPAAAAGGADPFAASGGGTFVNGGWIPNNNPGAITAAGGQAPAALTGPANTGPMKPGDAPGAPNVEGSYKDALLKMLNDGQQNPSLSDPALKSQADAFAVGQDRALQGARSAMAERMAQEGSTGTSSGAFDNNLAGLYQQQGEAQAGYNAGLVGNELQNRRQQLVQAAGLAGNQLNAEQGRALQEKLSNLDAQIRREGIASQNSLGQGDLALRGRLGDQQANLSLLGLLQNNDQFGRQLNQQNSQFGASLDQSGILGLLGMLG